MTTVSRLGSAGAFTLLSVASLTIMVGCVIVPGLPAVAQELGVAGASGWLVTLPSLGVVLFGLPAGRFIDRQGAYGSLCVGLALYGALGVVGMVLRGPVPVFADRLLLGGATALVMAAGTTLISDFYVGSARLAMIARQGMAIEMGGVVFLCAGGLLAVEGWRWPFCLYLIAWVFLGMVAVSVPRPPRSEATEVEEGSAHAEALGGVFLSAALSMIVFFTGVITLPLSLRALGLNEARTGYFLSGVSLVAVAGAFAMPYLVGRSSERATLGCAFLAYAAAFATFAASGSLPAFVVGGALVGTGFGLSIPLVNHMTMERSRPDQRGRNLARLSAAIFLGQFLASFMSLLPGGTIGIFVGAAAMSAVTATVLFSTPAFRRRKLA